MMGELPALGVSTVTKSARDAAELLLDAFYLQDARETYLLAGDVGRARLAAKTAMDNISRAFRTEFEDPNCRAEAAGRAFMRALFLQDEIENWSAFRAQADDPAFADALVSDATRTYGDDVNADVRWGQVRSLLRETCRLVGIDPRYAVLQSEFWRLHGQRDEEWCRYALDAHSLKVRAMVPDCDPDDAADLARYFVRGVRLHDGWEREDRTSDFSETADVVSRYYQRIFDLRNGAKDAN